MTNGLGLTTPNYKQYSLAELKDALANIDKEQFPQRAQTLIEEINARGADLDKPITPEHSAQPEFNEEQHPNFFIRYWKGQISLPVSYWLIGVTANVVIVILSHFAQVGVENASSAKLLGAYIFGLYVCMIVLTCWQTVGIYRSASKHPLRGGSAGWAMTAKVMVCLGCLGFLYQMYNSGFPIMKTSFLTLIGSERYPATEFRLLNNGTELEVFGGLEIGSETLLAEQLNLNPDVKILHLHSIGGRVLAAKRMMQVVRDHDLDTYVKTDCSSSCTLVYLAGKNKLLGEGAELRFHTASIGTVSSHTVSELGDPLKQAYLNQGLPKWFVDKVMSTSSDSFWSPSNEELLRAGVVDKIVDPDLYALSGLGTESSITKAELESGLLTQDYMVAMKKHDPETYQQALDLNYVGMRQGLPQAQIINQMVDLLYNHRLPIYLASAGNLALVEYFKAQIFRMKELRQEFPLACASFVYPDEVPEAKRYGNQGGISAEGKALESAALTMLINSYQDTHQNIDEEKQLSLILDVISKVRDENEAFYNVIVSAEDFVEQPDLMCAASIALNEAFISFDVETSGQLLRSIQN
ncbi:hypothetical protein [Paraglaciecola aestuariivivens]